MRRSRNLQLPLQAGPRRSWHQSDRRRTCLRRPALSPRRGTRALSCVDASTGEESDVSHRPPFRAGRRAAAPAPESARRAGRLWAALACVAGITGSSYSRRRRFRRKWRCSEEFAECAHRTTPRPFVAHGQNTRSLRLRRGSQASTGTSSSRCASPGVRTVESKYSAVKATPTANDAGQSEREQEIKNGRVVRQCGRARGLHDRHIQNLAARRARRQSAPPRACAGRADRHLHPPSRCASDPAGRSSSPATAAAVVRSAATCAEASILLRPQALAAAPPPSPVPCAPTRSSDPCRWFRRGPA